MLEEISWEFDINKTKIGTFGQNRSGFKEKNANQKFNNGTWEKRVKLTNSTFMEIILHTFVSGETISLKLNTASKHN